MRNIKINAGPLAEGEEESDRWQKLHEQCGESDKPIREALGYLCLWNWSTYPFVDITLLGEAGDMRLEAVYRKEDEGAVGYVLAAIWHTDHFGYHS